MNGSSGRWILTRVLADGCFDPLHYGHIRYLRAAAELGDIVIVRVAHDAEIVLKGRRPFQTLIERMATLDALSMVTRAVSHQTLPAAIYDLKPARLVKGAGWRGKLPEDVQAACQAVGTEIIFTDTQERTSRERLSA